MGKGGEGMMGKENGIATVQTKKKPFHVNQSLNKLA